MGVHGHDMCGHGMRGHDIRGLEALLLPVQDIILADHQSHNTTTEWLSVPTTLRHF